MNPKNVRLWGTSRLLLKIRTVIVLVAVKIFYPTVVSEDPVKSMSKAVKRAYLNNFTRLISPSQYLLPYSLSVGVTAP